MTQQSLEKDESLKQAEAAFLQASHRVIERARQTGTLIVISEDGAIKELTPDEAEARLAKKRPNEA